jgi:molecular chaperone HscB
MVTLRDMNYFELLDLPFAYSIDKGLLKRNFLMKSKEAHPDFFTQDSDEAQSAALELSAKLNDAYQILNNDERRLNYILEQRGVVLKDEKHQLSNVFLMEMMDLNESLDELNPVDAVALKGIQEQVNTAMQHNDQQMGEAIALAEQNKWQDADKANLKEIFYRRKYLLRILEKLATFALHK